jgi:GTP-binding protein HflX
MVYSEVKMKSLIETAVSPERIFLFGVDSQSGADGLWSIEDSLKELVLLAQTAGLVVAGQALQKRAAPDPSTYMGSGKLKQISEEMELLNVQTLILDDELAPGQQRNIETRLPEGFKVIDRTALILDIFAQHAHSREGKLQVELAQYQYRLPRLTRLWTHLVRQAGGRAGGAKGGVGLRGPGETQLESDRRLIRRRISSLKSELEEIRTHRRHYRRRRRNSGIPVISLTGYTNAGKSSLLRILSQEDVLVEDQLFATLDPLTRLVRLPAGREVLFTDTVGFIKRLPHELIAAFRATFEEIAESNLILHIIDSAHPKADAQVSAVEKVLYELGVKDRIILKVWNKMDKLDHADCMDDHSVSISALTGEGISGLKKRIESLLQDNMTLVEGLLRYSEGSLLDQIHRQGTVELEEHRHDGTYLRAYVPQFLAARIKPFIIISVPD